MTCWEDYERSAQTMGSLGWWLLLIFSEWLLHFKCMDHFCILIRHQDFTLIYGCIRKTWRALLLHSRTFKQDCGLLKVSFGKVEGIIQASVTPPASRCDLYSFPDVLPDVTDWSFPKRWLYFPEGIITSSHRISLEALSLGLDSLISIKFSIEGLKTYQS